MDTSRVEIYSIYPKKLMGTLPRPVLREMGMAAESDRISALSSQLRVFMAHELWEDAEQ